MYAVVDIETTGGKFNEEGITEIAIYKFDGKVIFDEFVTLVNPERPIQAYVEKLTGINTKMLSKAPKFYEIAKRIIEITEDCIIVAHNAEFDFRMLRIEFKRLGFKYNRDTICSVELSKKLLPDLPSYSLGKLVKSLGIHLSNRHRADGDALATVELFKILLDKDSEGTIVQECVKNLGNRFNDRLKEITDGLPGITGVYYIHNVDEEVIYIGKSKNIKKRVEQHFSGTHKKALNIQKQAAHVSYESTGDELLALLVENQQIKMQTPKYNHSLKRSKFTHALYPITNQQGYINLKILKIDKRKKHITTFTNYVSGKKFMNRIAEQYGLCEKMIGVYKGKNSCFKYEIQECAGACVNEENYEQYNERVRTIIDKYSFRNKNILIYCRGRNSEEKGFALVENGVFKGYGYYPISNELNSIEAAYEYLISLDDNKDARHILQSALSCSKPYPVKIFE